MKTLKIIPKFMAFALSQAIQHPKTLVSYYYCPACNRYLLDDERICPGCGKELNNSPRRKQMSPIPWWGAVLVIMVGITCWILGSCLSVTGLDEAGRALVYIPLGSLFGMSIPK